MQNKNLIISPNWQYTPQKLELIMHLNSPTHIILVYYSENDIKDIDNRCLHGHTRVYTVSLFVIKIFSVVCNTEMYGSLEDNMWLSGIC